MSDLSAINPDLKPRDPSIPIDFDPITVLGWITGDIKFDKLGDIKLSITIPHQFRSMAFGIWDARNGPILMRFERWAGPGDASSDQE